MLSFFVCCFQWCVAIPRQQYCERVYTWCTVVGISSHCRALGGVVLAALHPLWRTSEVGRYCKILGRACPKQNIPMYSRESLLKCSWQMHVQVSAIKGLHLGHRTMTHHASTPQNSFFWPSLNPDLPLLAPTHNTPPQHGTEEILFLIVVVLCIKNCMK